MYSFRFFKILTLLLILSTFLGCVSAVEYNNRSVKKGKKGQFEEAVKDATKAIEINPQYAKAYSNRCRAYIGLENYDMAIEDCNKALELKPDLYLAHHNRGLLYLKQRQYEMATKELTKAITLKTDYHYSYYERGRAHTKIKNYSMAIDDYKSAIKINPRYGHAYNNLAWLLATCENHQYRDGGQAVALATKAYDIGKRALNLDTLAAAFIENKDYDKAFISYKKAVGKEPKRIVRYKRSLKEKGCYEGNLDNIATNEFDTAIKNCVRQGNYL